MAYSVHRIPAPTSVSSTSSLAVAPNTASTGLDPVSGPNVRHTVQGAAGVPDRIALKAIKNHLSFLRSIGRTRVESEEVARALSLPQEQVCRLAFAVRGVKIA